MHRNLMSNPEWVSLTDAEKGQLVSMWIIAADKNGALPDCPNTIKKMCLLDNVPNIKRFVDLQFVKLDDANTTADWLPGGCQSDAPETGNIADAKKPSSRIKSPEYSGEFATAWAQYPKRAGNNPKKRAYRAWSARVREGAPTQSIIDGVKRYNQFVTVTQKINTEYVMQAATFFGPEKPFLLSWDIPKPENIKKTDEQWVALGESMGITARRGESMQEYLRRIEAATRDKNYT